LDKVFAAFCLISTFQVFDVVRVNPREKGVATEILLFPVPSPGFKAGFLEMIVNEGFIKLDFPLRIQFEFPIRVLLAINIRVDLWKD
jgi:hypothetical protein